MTHEEFHYSITGIESSLTSFIEQEQPGMNLKYLRFLVHAYYQQLLYSEKDVAARNMFKNMVKLEVLTKVSEDEKQMICCISGTGILLVNKLFDFLNWKFIQHCTKNPLNAYNIKKNFIARGVPLRKNLIIKGAVI